MNASEENPSLVKVVEAAIVMSASPNKDRGKSNAGNPCDTDSTQRTLTGQNGANCQFNASSSTASSTDTFSRRSCRRVSWPVRIVHFIREIRYRLKKKHSNQAMDHMDFCCSDSPTLSTRSSASGGNLKAGSPSCPSLIVTGVNAVRGSVKEKRLTRICRLSWHEDNEYSVRKHSAYEISTREKLDMVRRKLSSNPNLEDGSEQAASRLTEYVVNVKTSDRFGAGTDSKVFMQMFGELGESEVLPLAHSNNVNKFERNHLDRFVFRDAISMGKLQSIKIWHDNSGVGSAWHLAYVEVSDTSLGLLFRFPCHAWLSEHGDSQGLCRELRCFEVLQGPKRAVQTALGVDKHTLSDSMPSLSLKTLSGSLPVTPVMTRKSSKAPPPRKLTLQPIEKLREEIVESVFTPAPTRPAPTVRLPVEYDHGLRMSDSNSHFVPPVYKTSNTVPLISKHVLAQAAASHSSLDAAKRTVYGVSSTRVTNGHAGGLRVDTVRYASVSSLSSTNSDSERRLKIEEAWTSG